MDRNTQARKVSRIIYQHGGKMSPRLMDSALDLWERLMKSGDLSVDTTAADRRRKEREREEAKLSSNGRPSRSFKIGYGTGRTLAYQIGNDGELIVTPDKPGTYTHKDYEAMLEAITRDIERRERAMEKSKKTGSRWSRAPMLLHKPRTIASRQWEQPKTPKVPKAKAEPPRVETKAPAPPQPVTQPPQAPLDSRGKYDLSRMNGHQLAGMRAGLDPMTPGLETMTLDQMKALAADQAKTAVAGIAERSGLAYVRDNRPRRF